MYTLIYFTLLVLSYDKNNFHKKLQYCEGGTILKAINAELVTSSLSSLWIFLKQNKSKTIIL